MLELFVLVAAFSFLLGTNFNVRVEFELAPSSGLRRMIDWMLDSFWALFEGKEEPVPTPVTPPAPAPKPTGGKSFSELFPSVAAKPSVGAAVQYTGGDYNEYDDEDEPIEDDDGKE